MATANVKAVITADDRASSTIRGVGGSFGKLAGAMAVGQLAANAATKAFDLLADTVKNSVGAAFEQVRQVENSTIALKAYEKNGEKVNKVLKELISFARSDMGVLFQREDLFAAAQTLKLYGQSTDSLTGKVKILAKGVSLGKTSFQELSSIVGRAAAKGRLDAVDFDMLIERGIGLDKSFRGATVTSEELFKALDKALPAELLEGRANTIDGAFIRLQSSLRDVGSAILGVDSETSKFIEGGLGDRFMDWVKGITERLKDPEFKKKVEEWIAKINDFIKNTDWKAIGNTILTIAKAILATAGAVASAIGWFNKWRDRAISALGFILFKVQQLPNDIKKQGNAFYNALISPWKKAFDFIMSGFNKVKEVSSSFSPINVGKSLLKNLPGFQTGTGFAPGGFARVGEQGAEVVHLPRGSKVTPTNSVKEGNASTINITVQAGAFMGSPQDARKYADMIVRAIKDNAQMNGLSVNQMLAA